MSGLVAWPGIPVEFPGRGKLIVPPLALGDVEQLHERLSKFKGGVDPESIKTVIDAAHAALVLNYPELTRADVGRMIGLGNMPEVFEAVMDVGGLNRKRLEAAAAGEAPAPASPSTGANSTPT